MLRLSVGCQNHFRINEVVRRHFLETAKAVVLSEDITNDQIDAILDQLEGAIDKNSGETANWLS